MLTRGYEDKADYENQTLTTIITMNGMTMMITLPNLTKMSGIHTKRTTSMKTCPMPMSVRNTTITSIGMLVIRLSNLTENRKLQRIIE